jgi:hypothetical protein
MVTYDCSEECQVTDWRSHKKWCTELLGVNGSRSAFNTSRSTLYAFINSNYFDIAKEVYRKTQECNIPKKYLLVEIDFYGDAPALRNEFKVWLASGFLEGSSGADAPGWFVRMYVDKRRVQFEPVTSDQLRVVCRAGNGMVSVRLVGVPVADADGASYQLLSDEAVESIGREDYDRMVACLGKNMADGFLKLKKSGLA